MSCLYPKLLTVLRGAGVDKDGNVCDKVIFGKDGTKDGLQWFKETGAQVDSFIVPCGQCVECRLNKCRQWVDRLKMEAYSYPSNELAFLTLTYSSENLPADNSLHIEHLQGFLKRLRIALKRKFDKEVRFFACGEYGDKGEELTGFGRPHYHIILFGFDFFHNDILRVVGKNKYGDLHYCSEDLVKSCWTFGFNTVCHVTDKVMFYVASYTMKSVKGKALSYTKLPLLDSKGLQKHDKITDDPLFYLSPIDKKGRRPPFCTMSRRPGIGSNYIRDNLDNIRNSHSIVIPGGRSATVAGYSLDIVKKEDLVLGCLLADISRGIADNRNDYLVHKGIDPRSYNEMVSAERQERKKLKETMKNY